MLLCWFRFNPFSGHLGPEGDCQLLKSPTVCLRLEEIILPSVEAKHVLISHWRLKGKTCRVNWML